MGTKLISITLKSAKLNQAKEFYSRLGFQFEEVKVSKGSEIFRSRAQDLELSLISDFQSIPDHLPTLQLSFQVPQIDPVFQGLQSIQGVVILLEPTEMPEGRKAIVKDPDGHAIEILQPRT